jgi:hypothetical protein
LAKERMAVSEKGYKNGIGVMTAKERTAASKKGYDNGIGLCRSRQRVNPGK